MIEEFIETGTGPRLFLRSLVPAVEVQAVVVIAHGFNSHSGYYEWVAGQIAALSIAIYALDLRGRGRSEGERFYVESFDDYATDIAAVVALAKSRHPGEPVYLLGHSAGGVASCVYVLDHPDELAGLICESFAYQLPAPNLALTVLKGLSHLAPHTHVLKLHNADFSRDPAAVAAMDADPLIADESQPSLTIAAMVRADERLTRDFAHIALPLLILHGTADKAAKCSGSVHFHASAASSDKTIKLYEGAFHDLLNDIGKAEVMHDIKTWLSERLDNPQLSLAQKETD